MKRRLATLTNEELSQILAMRNRKLEAWLAQHKWGPIGTDTAKQVHYHSAVLHSISIMECLAEVEARAIPNNRREKPYLAKSIESRHHWLLAVSRGEV